MDEKAQEWLKQAAYDLDTARYMFDGGRYFYAVFMCHLSIEKALKGLFFERKKQIPPKTHSLIYFIERLQLTPPEKIGRFIVKLNEASVVTRYPENLEKISHDFTKPVVGVIIENTKEVFQWIKEQL